MTDVQEMAGNSGYAGLDRLIDESGWPDGLERFAAQSPETAYFVGTDFGQGHAAWKGFLSYQRRESAFVIDTTCGTAALSLARDFSAVDAFYPDASILRGARERIAHSNRTHISIHSKFAPAPQSYDAVAGFGVPIESLTPPAINLLADALRPHGSLFLVARNAAPGTLTSVVSPPFSLMLETLRRRFRNVTPYRWLGPITKPWELCPMEADRLPWKSRLAGWVAARRPSILAVAASNDSGPSLYEEILAAGGRNLLPERYLFAHPVSFGIIAADRASGRRVIIRIPLDDLSVRRARINFEALSLPRTHLPFAIPQPLEKGECRGVPFFVEQMLEGHYIRRKDLLDEPTRRRVLSAATQAVIRLHRNTAQPVDCSRAVLEHSVIPLLDAADHSLAGHAPAHVMHSLREWLLASFQGQRLNLVLQHGDYTHANLLVTRDRKCVTGAFDWDLTNPQGLPLIDLFYFLAAAERVRTGASLPDIFINKMQAGFSDFEHSLISQYREALDVPADLFLPLFVLAWLHHIGVREYREESHVYLKGYWSDLLNAADTLRQSRHESGVSMPVGRM